MASANNSLLELAGIRSLIDLAESADMRDCLLWFGAEKRWIDQTHLDLCRVPAPTFQEDERAAWMADRFREMGYAVRIDRAGNVIAGEDLAAPGPFTALSAHLDTVLSPGKPEHVLVNGNGRFEGPGVADNGAGLTGLLALARVLRSRDLLGLDRSRVLFIANVGEEGEGNLSGMRFLCRPAEMGKQIGAFLVLDGPSVDRITSSGVASRRFKVTIQGPGGHSWSDFGIANPVHALSRAVAMFADEARAGLPPARNGRRTTFNFGRIDGGTSVNAIPAEASAKLDLRSEDPEQIEKMAAQLTPALERAIAAEHSRASGRRLNARVREIGSRPGGVLARNAPILQCLRAVDAYLGIRSIEDCASTDANIPLSMGRQAVSIGAGGSGGGAHTPDEWYDPEGREIGLKRILLVLFLLVKSGAA
jgi:acetylornithine deacetylase/succinyl-diaminopimelate desuccinylase-like protein